MARKKMHCHEYSPVYNPVSKYEDPIKAMRRSGTCSWYIFHKNRPCHPFISTFYCLNGFEEEDVTKTIDSKLMSRAQYDPKASWEVKNLFEAGRKRRMREERREAVEALQNQKAMFTSFCTTMYTVLREVDDHVEWRDKSDKDIGSYVKNVAERHYEEDDRELKEMLEQSKRKR